MTRDEVPPRAVSIIDAISRATCTAATVHALGQLLNGEVNRGPTLSKQSTSCRRPQTQKTHLRASKPQGNKARKQPPVTVLEDREDGRAIHSSREKYKLATEVVNTSLKVLTAAIQSQTGKSTKLARRPSRSELNQPSPTIQNSDIQSPLQSLSLNCVTNTSGGKRRIRRSSSARLVANGTSLLAIAECGSLGFAMLVSAENQKNSEKDVSPLQLEHGMSVFVSKLIALGFHELAIRELRILRNRLDKSEPFSAKNDGGRRTASSRASKIPPDPADESLSEILMFRSANANGPLLNLMITTQLQTLRVMAAKSDPRPIEAALKYLDLSGPCSPVALIERQIDHSSPESSNKAAQQLESLSRLLTQFCGGLAPSEQQKDSGQWNSIPSSVVFQYQVLALEIRLKWWKVARHDGDAMHELLRPLERHLDCFRRRSALSVEEKYSHCKEPVERILARLSEFQNEAGMSVDNVQQALSRLELIRADLASESSKFEESSLWMKQSHQHLTLSNPSKSQICLFMCRRAILSIRSYLQSQRRQQMLDYMIDLSVILDQDLGIDHEEIMEIVVALNVLRKSVLALIRTHQRRPISTSQPDLDIIIECAKTMSSGVNFLNGLYTARKRQDSGGGSASPLPSGCRLVSEVALSFIDPIAMLAKLSMASSAGDWDLINVGLQCCTKLARKFDQRYNTELSKEQEYDIKRSSFVAISNAYWCRFLHFKQNSQNCLDLRKLLTASIDPIKDQPISIKQSALLLAKLEKLASLYELSEEYEEAAEAHADIIKYLTASGSVSAAAEAASRQSLQVVFDKNGAFTLLGRSIIGYQKALSLSSDEARARLALDLQGLPASEKGMILEYQLKSTCSIVASSELAANLLSVYTDVNFPIRRLRVINRLTYRTLCRPPAAFGMSLQYGPTLTRLRKC